MAIQLTKLNLRIVLKWMFENILDQGNSQYERTIDFDDFLTDGTAIDQGQVVWYDQRSVTASATDSLDLAGSLISAYGTAITFAKIKLVYVENTSVTVGDNLNIVRPAANGVPLFGAASDLLVLPPGGVFLWYTPSAAGITVTAGTGDLLNIVEAGAANTVTYRIAIAGTGTVA